jgi:hypothetical protein
MTRRGSGVRIPHGPLGTPRPAGLGVVASGPAPSAVVDSLPMAQDEDLDEDEERARYRELLEELRTIIPGVQVLFAFLLTVPFSARFTALDDLGVYVFAVAMATVGLAAVTLMTPAAYHRIAPRKDRHQRLVLGVRITVAGMVLLAVSIACSIFVVGRLIFATELANGEQVATAGTATELALVVVGIVVGTAVALWFVLPLLRREHDGEHGGA